MNISLPSDLCSTCQHPLASHDAISKRWCAATELGVGRRDCICSGSGACRPRARPLLTGGPPNPSRPNRLTAYASPMALARAGFGAIGLVLVLALSGCSSGNDTPSATSAAPDSSTPLDRDATSATDPGTPSSASAPPDLSGTASPSAGVTPGTSASQAPVSCPSVNPVRVSRADTAPRRATEVVTVVSDGTNLTSGTREQNDFLTPSLTAPDGATASDPAAFEKISKLLAAQKHRVLLARPDPRTRRRRAPRSRSARRGPTWSTTPRAS